MAKRKARSFIAKLLKKYRSKDTFAVAERTKKLMMLTLGKNQEPEELVNDLAVLETQY